LLFTFMKNKIINEDHSCCWVCNTRFTVSNPPGSANLEEHHVFPQNAGGTDGPLVRLCDTDHTRAHKLANALHKNRIATELIASLPQVSQKKLLWLASQIVKAEKATVNDPNKVWKNPVNLEGQAPAVLKVLQNVYPGLSRPRIVELALINLLKRK